MDTSPIYVANPHKLYDMREGYSFARNILGFSDPSVAFVDGQWTMFLGGMDWSFRTNIYRFCLPIGAPLSSNDWVIDHAPGKPHKAVAIMSQPSRGSWNRCMHSVCYVKGKNAAGDIVERIYHAGRSSERVLNKTLPYRIGYAEKINNKWVSCTSPLPLHSNDRPSVLEPKVEFVDGLWRMRFLSIPAGDIKDPEHHFTIYYSESRDGVTGWSQPVVFTDQHEGYFDSIVVPHGSEWLMILTRDSNLDGKTPYPQQGIWLSRSRIYSGMRRNWSDPELILDANSDSDDWYRGGMCSPSAAWGTGDEEEAQTLYVFFVTATAKTHWLSLAIKSVLRGKRPPVPSPFYFAIGRLAVKINGSYHA